MRKALSWVLLLFGAFIALSGIIDFAVGPELAEQEPGVAAGEGGPRWYGAAIAVLGFAMIALAVHLSRAAKPER